MWWCGGKKNKCGGVVEGKRNVVVVMEEKEMWCRWYIVSPFTKLC